VELGLWSLGFDVWSLGCWSLGCWSLGFGAWGLIFGWFELGLLEFWV